MCVLCKSAETCYQHATDWELRELSIVVVIAIEWFRCLESHGKRRKYPKRPVFPLKDIFKNVFFYYLGGGGGGNCCIEVICNLNEKFTETCYISKFVEPIKKKSLSTQET